MKREWKPGDVALVRSMYGNKVVGLRTGVPSNRGWAYSEEVGGGNTTQSWSSDPEGNYVIRPLAVIDPEDREQVERLIRLFCHHTPRGDAEFVLRHGGIDNMQAALREFADPKPPKPEEPLGVGAVIEDAEGSIWVRVGRKPGNTWYRPHGVYARYSDLDIIRKLSDGWAGEDA